MENIKAEVNWSEVNKEEAELACLGDMCCWKEADQFQRVGCKLEVLFAALL